MKKVGLFTVVFCLLFATTVFPFFGLTPTLPVKAGDILYMDAKSLSKSGGLPLSSATYTYLGVRGGSIVLELNEEMTFPDQANTSKIKELYFPVNNGQALLIVHGFSRTATRKFPKGLLVTVDSLGRITKAVPYEGT